MRANVFLHNGFKSVLSNLVTVPLEVSNDKKDFFKVGSCNIGLN